ncbi:MULTISPECIES: hypothetical protein [Paracoccus]|jgi:hypothetical protein|uniref:Uncharacterized protein n=1 Tax=Paracoccus denitrificans (strain Pd 1222) TaxID=318586 RepID=A1B1B2_PARDP|nr:MULTISPECIES: hypothetical protein [Paracoccus]ABL69306.1 conserved hypothetical protein [Paracoccus denitrificans PD1222]MBB4630105.1 hypothetical protein [Paracoccus denitrificans]MCU7431442.1 hypothetical protein [Paracoccus denitrificans]QAR27310.1 hypothetical protein EO213_13955 [Paracoccus denitrificans]UFS64682.1 hypothetical protein LO749_11025 [Paracoccus denitrificans]
MTKQNLETHYRTSFIPRAHRIGRITLLIAMVICLLPALYLSFVLGAWPGAGVILTGFLAVLAFVGIIWIVEPISYFPVLGVCGTYMSFLSGNIGNMRMPVVISCQQAVEAETGSRKAEVAAVLGIAVSVLVNLVFLVALVVIGRALIDAMPAPMAVAVKEYTLPALYGAVLVMFLNSATRRNALTGILCGLAIFLSPIPGVLGTAVAGVLAILVCFATNRKTARPAGGQTA